MPYSWQSFWNSQCDERTQDRDLGRVQHAGNIGHALVVLEVDFHRPEENLSAFGQVVRADGIDNDVALYLSSLIPQERGFLWSFDDCIKGNAEKGRRPVTTLINELAKYPGLLDIIVNIEGIIKKNRLSCQTSGSIFGALLCQK